MEKKKILIVADEKSFTDFVKLGLERSKRYEVMTENNGLRGFITAKQFKTGLMDTPPSGDVFSVR